MKNKKVLDAARLLENVKVVRDACGGKKICAMVKANAYGHGLENVAKILSGKVEYFGVVSVDEALRVRRVSDDPILICSKMCGEDFLICKKRGLEFFVDDENDLRGALKAGAKDLCHLKINCGMNRFGVKSGISAKMINDILESETLKLKSICAHFPNTASRHNTMKNYQKFLEIRAEISQNAPICFGGSGMAKFDFPFDMLRVGIAMYGYDFAGVKPVMKICSYVKKNIFCPCGRKCRLWAQVCCQECRIFCDCASGIWRWTAQGFKRKI